MSQVTSCWSPMLFRNVVRLIRCPVFLVVVFFAGNVFAQTVSSEELINKAKDYDGQTIVYQGEVIGEVMARGDHAWVNLKDAKNALGIWILKNLTGNIANTGAYKSTGDMVEVKGIFHRACLEHGGDLDIHAESLRLVKSGNRIKQHLSLRKLKTAYSLGAILIILWISTILAKSRKRK